MSHHGSVVERNTFGTAGTLAVGRDTYAVHRLADVAPAGLLISLRIVLAKPAAARGRRPGDRRAGGVVARLGHDGPVGRRGGPQPVPRLPARHQRRAGPRGPRGSARRRGVPGRPGDLVNPTIPCELVVDHSVIADVFGRSDAHRRNVEIEYKLGDSVTTDHVSPAGAIPPRTPAGRYLTRLGVPRSELNSYASRRGNHEVMMRGCFANVRLRNHLVPGEVGGWTRNFRTGSVDTVFDAARTDRDAGVPLLVLGGREYGSGSSRDWAAKGPALLGVRVVLAESFERIHRSNLIGMGVLPLQFQAGEGAAALRLTGEETYEVRGLRDAVERRGTVTVLADGRTFRAIVRIDTEREADYYRHGGILPYVLRRLLAGS